MSFGVNIVNIKYFWKIQIFGGAPPFFVSILGHFYLNIAILGLFCFPILVAEHVYEPFYIVYVIGIVASGTLEAF